MATRTSVQDGDWDDPATWDTGVPTSSDNAYIEHVVNVDGGSQECHELRLRDAEAENYVKLSNGATLTCFNVEDESDHSIRAISGNCTLVVTEKMSLSEFGTYAAQSAPSTTLVATIGSFDADNDNSRVNPVASVSGTTVTCTILGTTVINGSSMGVGAANGATCTLHLRGAVTLIQGGIIYMSGGATSTMSLNFYTSVSMSVVGNRIEGNYGTVNFFGPSGLDPDDVREGVLVDATVGTLVVPNASDVRAGTTFDSNDSQTGSLNATVATSGVISG